MHMTLEGMAAHRVAAILLAAGRSARMGCDKLALSFGGKTMLGRAVELLSILPVAEKLLVATTARAERLELPQDIRLVTVDSQDSVQSDSIRLGVLAAGGTAADGTAAGNIESYMFLTGDQPLLTLEDALQLLEAAASHKDSIIYANVRGLPCTPTVFPARLKCELISISGDRGGRAIIRSRHGECLPVDVTHPEHFIDIDTEQDYFNNLKKVW